jgi:hypothetical protein
VCCVLCFVFLLLFFNCYYRHYTPLAQACVTSHIFTRIGNFSDSAIVYYISYIYPNWLGLALI